MQFLQQADFHTGTWRRLSQELAAELQRLRELNDQDHDPVKSAGIRGEIRRVKRILALADEARATAASPEQALVIAGGDLHQET